MKETNKSVDTKVKFPYLDILYCEHPNPKNHQRMSMEARAGQFSPFAALTGYEEKVKETARLTDKKIELEEEEKQELNNKLNLISLHLTEEKEVTITYFLKDNKKQGGKYLDKTGIIRKIDLYNNNLIFKDKTKINIEDILNINIDNIEKTYF